MDTQHSSTASTLPVPDKSALSAPSPAPDAAAAAAAAAAAIQSWEPDWEYYEPMFDRFSRENDPLKCEGYLSIHHASRPLRTVRSAVPDDLIKSLESGMQSVLIDPVARSAAELMVLPWSTVRFKYGGDKDRERSALPRASQFPDISYDEAAIAGEKSPKTDKDAAAVSTTLDKDILAVTTTVPQMPPRPRVFRVFPMVYPEPILPPNMHGKPAFERRGMEIAVQFGDLTFDAGGITEPFNAVAFLYDTELEEKVSENFSWSVGDSSHSLAVFMVEQTKPSVYLVVVLLHIIRGDYDDAVDPYTKALNPKDASKLKAEIEEATMRLRLYKQVFAWTALQMFAADGVLIRAGETKLQSFSKIKEDLQSFVVRIGNERERSRMRMLPLTLNTRVEKLDRSESLYSFTDPLGIAVIDEKKKEREGKDKTPSPPNAVMKPLAREVMKFATPNDIVVPYLDYVNVLYFYPDQVNFNSYKGVDSSARNILLTVRLLDDDDMRDSSRVGLPAMFCDTGMEPLVRVPLQYHTKRPKFLPMDEVKIQLPHTITPRHHILVTFSHVECKPSRKGKGDESETVLGYCFIPLIEDGRMIKDEKKIKPVAIALPSGYLKVANDADSKRHVFKWVENGKPIFAYRTKLISTVYTQDSTLIQLSHLNPKEITRVNERVVLESPAKTPTPRPRHEASPSTSGEESPDEEVHIEDLPAHLRAQKTIDALAHTPVEELIRFFPMVVNKLLSLMTCADDNVSYQSWMMLIQIVRSVDIVSKRKSVKEPILESFVEYIFKTDPTLSPPVHEVMIKKWIDSLIICERDLESTRALALNYAWFFLGIIFKDMVMTLYYKKTLKDSKRKGRFSDETVERLQKLIMYFSAKVDLLRAEYTMAKELNRAVAFFLRNMFDLLDRGIAFRMAHSYISSIDKSHNYPDLQELKFIAIRIFCDHKQYIQLNLPTEEISLGSLDTVELGLFQRHFLAGLLLREVKTGVLSAEQYTRLLSLTTLRDIISKHDREFQAENESDSDRERRRIAAIYFPFFLTILDNFPALFPEDKRLTEADEDEIRQWLVCFLYILKEVDSNLFSQWSKVAQRRQKLVFLSLLVRIPEVFKYPGKENCSQIFVHQPTREESTALPASPGTPELRNPGRGKKMSTAVTKNLLEERYGVQSQGDLRRGSVICVNPNPLNIKQEELVPMFKYLALESSRIVLERIFAYIADNKDLKNETDESVEEFQRTFDALVPLFGREQCHEFLALFFFSLQSFLKRFRKQIFKLQTTACQSLTIRVMEHCNSVNVHTRSKAAATLTNMILFNFYEVKNFARMKLQCTFATSKLVFQDTDFEYLNKSLDAVSKFLEKASIKTTQGTVNPFKIDMPELKQRLYGVVRDSVSMRQYEHDKEMTVDLYHQISKGYLDSPDLRIVWLDNIAKYHIRGQHWEECAQTYVLMAALVSKYLCSTRGFPINLPFDMWKSVFPMIDRESTMPQPEMLVSVKDEICLGKEFTSEGYETLLRDAVEVLLKASLFEESIEVYQLLLPLFRAEANYQKQAAMYMELKDLCIRVVKEAANNTRVAPNYYRVTFLGKEFGAAANKEFVYKESNSVRIADFTERLKKQFEGKFPVEIVPNTKELKAADLSSGKNFIQLGAVLPLPEETLGRRQTTALNKHFNISQFVMEVPFTKGGKAQGDIAEQWKRRTIFKIDGAFPNIKKRAVILDRREVLVPPIRVAQELIQDKLTAIEGELNKASAKTLQILLQGSLLACVNVGPLEICRVFLLSDRTKLDPVPDQMDVQHLGETTSLFIRKLGFALKLNQQIAPDQVELHFELAKKYEEFKTLFAQFTGTRPASSPAPDGDPAFS